MIQIACEKCGTVLRVPETMAGKRGRCQSCGIPISVPADAASGGIASKLSAAGASAQAAVVAAAKTVKLPRAASGKYPEIVQNAQLVRWGAGLISAWGWFTLVMGAIVMLVGVVAVVIGLFSSSGSFGTAAAVSFGISCLSEGFWAVIGGILLIALAAFFRLISHTCEAVRDSVIDQLSSPPSEAD